MSSKFVKPSSPTPQHLKKKKLSFVDQAAPPAYVPLIFYYSSHNTYDNYKSMLHRLETSLSQTLTKFYPLAGRLDVDHLSINCTDEGVEFLEAEVNFPLSQILHGQIDYTKLSQFVPWPTPGSSTAPLLVIQINKFSCGGVGVGMNMTHEVADGFSATTFIKAWASSCQAGTNYIIPAPTFELGNLFPAITDHVRIPKYPFAFKNKLDLVTRRFVFEGTAISKLKAQVVSGDGGLKGQASRVKVVSALIWKALMGVSRAKHGYLRPSLLVHSMNLRDKVVNPTVSPTSFGNMYKLAYARFKPDDDQNRTPELHNLVSLQRDALSSAKSIPGEELFSAITSPVEEIIEEKALQEIDAYRITSLCGFPQYGIDFGWGKPVWVGGTQISVELLVVLMNNASGDGVEVEVSLDEEDMLHFQKDPDIIAFTNSSPILY